MTVFQFCVEKVWNTVAALRSTARFSSVFLKDLSFVPCHAWQLNGAREKTLSGGLQWLKTIWDEFPVPKALNSFTGSGYY